MPLFVSHVGKSMYPVQLERWFNLFGRENFKVGSLRTAIKSKAEMGAFQTLTRKMRFGSQADGDINN